MLTWEEHKKRLLGNPEFKKEYEKLGDEMAEEHWEFQEVGPSGFTVSGETWTSMAHPKAISFFVDDEEVGKLSWESGICTFEGNVDRSADAFFDAVCWMINVKLGG